LEAPMEGDKAGQADTPPSRATHPGSYNQAEQQTEDRGGRATRSEDKGEGAGKQYIPCPWATLRMCIN